ncbi:MAG: TOBE domain-containing protein [Xanthomonadales bacterium]|nr:TOBE domain-containing protein [Xanthomonadales bacterium]
MNFFPGTLGSVSGGWEFRGAGFRLKLPPSGELSSGPATLGVRPEDLRLSPNGVLRATVRVVEPIGSEVFVHLTTADGAPAIARAPADVQVTVEERVGFEIPPAKVHLFSGASGVRIGP